MKLRGWRKLLFGFILLLNADVAYFLSNAENKLDLLFDFLIFLGGLLIIGNVGSHVVDRIKVKSNSIKVNPPEEVENFSSET